MSDIAALTDRAAYLARLADVAAESVDGLDLAIERLTAELTNTKDARKAAADNAKAAAADAVAAEAELAAAHAAPAGDPDQVTAAAGVAKGSAR